MDKDYLVGIGALITLVVLILASAKYLSTPLIVPAQTVQTAVVQPPSAE